MVNLFVKWILFIQDKLLLLKYLEVSTLFRNFFFKYNNQDGTYILTNSRDNSLKLIDTRKYEVVRSYRFINFLFYIFF